MSLTFGRAKNILAQYQGKGGKLPSAEQSHDFTLKVLQYLLYTGSPKAERTFDLCAVNGVFTAPYELEAILKVKINGRVGTALSQWFAFREGMDFNKGCYGADTVEELANEFYTAYDGPVGGFHVGVQGTATEAQDAGIIIAGKDTTGRQIFTNHKGADIAGEYLSIVKNQVSWSNVLFADITGIYKAPTIGYTPLLWRQGNFVEGFLSDFSPSDEAPTYRRFRLNVSSCPDIAKISVLGRTRLKDHYADTDRIPFDNLYSIEVAGQQHHANFNNQLESAVQKDKFVQTLVEREATHKRPSNGTPVEFSLITSAGSIRGLVRR